MQATESISAQVSCLKFRSVRGVDRWDACFSSTVFHYGANLKSWGMGIPWVSFVTHFLTYWLGLLVGGWIRCIHTLHVDLKLIGEHNFHCSTRMSPNPTKSHFSGVVKRVFFIAGWFTRKRGLGYIWDLRMRNVWHEGESELLLYYISTCERMARKSHDLSTRRVLPILLAANQLLLRSRTNYSTS